MDVTLADRLMVEANPWWRDPDWSRRDVYLRRVAQAPFRYRPASLTELTPGGLYLLRGPRRVGKSTEIKRAIADLIDGGLPPRKVLFASVEGWRAADLELFVTHAATQLDGPPGECFWFLDEVTSMTGAWPAVIKRLRDTHLHFAEDTVVLSGSSAAQFDEATKALAGRRGRAVDSDRLLLQMPFVDVARAFGHSLPVTPRLRLSEAEPTVVSDLVHAWRPWLPELVHAWDRYLQIGGYPQAVADYLSQGAVDPSFTNTLFEVVHGDALARGHLSPTQTTAGLRAMSRSLSSLFEVSSMAAHMDVVAPTAKDRLEDLRRSFLAYPVHREQGLAAKPRSQSKWYFTDPRLARLAADRGAGPPPDPTTLSEQQTALVLLRSLEAEAAGAALRHDQLLYYRSATRAEIDFVAATWRGVCVESKYVDRGWGRAFQTIASSPYRFGMLATRSGLGQHDAGWALPAGLLACLLGA